MSRKFKNREEVARAIYREGLGDFVQYGATADAMPDPQLCDALSAAKKALWEFEDLLRGLDLDDEC